MSAFVSPAGTDALPTVAPPLLGSAATLGGPRRSSLIQPSFVYPHLQEQTQQYLPSVTAAAPQVGMAAAGPGAGVQMGIPMGVDGDGRSVAAGPQADERHIEGEAESNQFAHVAVRLLWGALRADEQHLQLDSQGRGPYIGWGPWGPQLGASPHKATYEENGNAFDLSDAHEWLALPQIFTRLLCRCGAADGTTSNPCTCSPLPPHGFIAQINRLWVADGSELFLWEVGAGEEAVERLTLPGAIESVAYAELSREVLPPAFRSSFSWDDSSLSTSSIFVHLNTSGCSDSPPFCGIASSPLHCLVVSVSSSVCLFALSRTADASAQEQQQGRDSQRGLPVAGVDFVLLGMAAKPRGGPLGAFLELSKAAAHHGSSLVFFGSSEAQQIYLLDVAPLPADSARLPQLLKRARGLRSTDAATAAAPETSGAALRAVLPSVDGDAASGFKSWMGRGSKGNSLTGLVSCKLVPLNPKLSDWLKWGLSVLSSSLGFGGSDASRNNQSTSCERARKTEGVIQLEVDEPRGIVWALGGDSSISAFLVPVPSTDAALPAHDASKHIKTLRLSCKEIEDGLRRVSADWRRCPSGRGRLLGPLLRSGGFRAVALSVTAPYEGHSVVAIVVDAVGKEYIQLTLPVLLQQPLQQLPQQQLQQPQQQPQQRWDDGVFGLQQHQQQSAQLSGTLCPEYGSPAAQSCFTADACGSTFQGLPAGLSKTSKGLVLYASRLLRPLMGTPLVEAALLPCGIARGNEGQPQLQQLLQLQQQDQPTGGSRKRGRGFEWEQMNSEGNAQSELSACLIGRFSAPATTKLLLKLACLYEVIDAVYTTLFYAFGQRASLQPQHQQQFSSGLSWGLPLRGAPPHFTALRLANSSQAGGSGAIQAVAAELQQQEVIWTSISLADAVELSILYGVSKVLITAHEMLTAYRLLMQQVGSPAELGKKRFIAPLMFDRLLSVTLTDLCMSLEAREHFRQSIFEILTSTNPALCRLFKGALFTSEELQAQLAYARVKGKIEQFLEQQQSPNLAEIQMLVVKELMELMQFLPFLPLEGLVGLLDNLRLYDLLVTVVLTKAAQVSSRKSRRYPTGRRPKWPLLSANPEHRMADVEVNLVAGCYRHVTDCLARHCKVFATDKTHPSAEVKQQQDGQSNVTNAQEDAKGCAVALVNACLASNDERLRNYVLKWLAAHGGANFPVSHLQMDGPTAELFLPQYHARFAIDLGERYAASGLYAQAAKCHSLQGLQQWAHDSQANLPALLASDQKEQQEQGADSSATSAVASGVLAFDEGNDGFCCELTKPIWQLLACWLTKNAQKPSLEERLDHFSKAKESAQLWMQHASGLGSQGLYSADDKAKKGRAAAALTASCGLAGLPNDSWQDAPSERSLQQIDLNIRMVGLQRALLRDAARIFCYLIVSSIHSLRRERALASGLAPPPPAQPVSPDEAEALCREVLATTGTAPFDASVQPRSPSDFGAPILALMLDLQRRVYAPGELLELVTARIRDPRVAERLTPQFPSLAALRLCGQRAATAVACYSAGLDDAEEPHAALDSACMSFLSFAEASSSILLQTKILSDALRDLLALPDPAVRECCSRSLKRLSVVLHMHAQTHWSGREVSMTNAEGETVVIPGFTWPAWRLAECGVPYGTLAELYLSYEHDDSAKQHSGLLLDEMQTIFCWIFEQWLTCQDDVAAAGTFVGLLHDLKESGDLPYFGPTGSVLLRSQLTDRERNRADAAAQQLEDVLFQIETAMATTAQVLKTIKKDRHFMEVKSRLAILKQQVAEYRAGLHDRHGLLAR
ncbi:hypothetical protein Efla_000195 [Eimeria flavescens]